jgi:hypothetical protein
MLMTQEDTVDKNYNLKNDPHYGKSNLRQRVSESIKRQRDETCEVKEAPVKVLHDVAVDSNRDSVNLIKHYRNKYLND